MDDNDAPRTAFTPGWNRNLIEKESLPIKTSHGKVIRVIRQNSGNQAIGNEDDDDDSNTSNDADDSGDEVDVHISPYKSKHEKAKISTTPASSDIETLSYDEIQVIIGKICTECVSNPENSLKKKRETDEKGEQIPKLVDLFSFWKHKLHKVRELSILSTFLVFKDICPSYRIRPADGNDKEIQLKKETKRLRDYELSLLVSYQTFLNYLDKLISEAFGKSIKNIKEWTNNCKLALSALRCQCELLRYLIHFNYRSQLLNSILFYACHSNIEISSVCCSTIQTILQKENDGEVAYEIVKTTNQVITSLKFEVPEQFLHILEYVRLQVHADDAKQIHKQAKNERRKRRRNSDDVELGLLEADATSNKSISRRFQADCLRDVSLIYFRIIKMKIGFRLLPTALQGLGRITHLLDMDTVLDLMAILRRILTETAPAAPALVRLLCIHCGLRTLSGPGKELGLDEDVYITALRQLVIELPLSLTFDKWEVLFESIEYCFLKRTESRNPVVLSFVRLLLLLSAHVRFTVGSVALSLAHAILLRYPRARGTLAILGRKSVTGADDAVADRAMRALRDEASLVDDGDGDGSWVLTLLTHCFDTRLKNIVNAVSSTNILPLPLCISHAKSDDSEVVGTLDSVFLLIPSAIRTVNVKSHKGNGVDVKTPKKCDGENRKRKRNDKKV